MSNWKNDRFITGRNDLFVVIEDKQGNRLWAPYREGDCTFASPFPKGYVPQIGEKFSIMEMGKRSVFDGGKAMTPFKLSHIHSLTSPSNIILTLIVSTNQNF